MTNFRLRRFFLLLLLAALPYVACGQGTEPLLVIYSPQAHASVSSGIFTPVEVRDNGKLLFSIRPQVGATIVPSIGQHTITLSQLADHSTIDKLDLSIEPDSVAFVQVLFSGDEVRLYREECTPAKAGILARPLEVPGDAELKVAAIAPSLFNRCPADNNGAAGYDFRISSPVAAVNRLADVLLQMTITNHTGADVDFSGVTALRVTPLVSEADGAEVACSYSPSGTARRAIVPTPADKSFIEEFRLTPYRCPPVQSGQVKIRLKFNVADAGAAPNYIYSNAISLRLVPSTPQR